MKVFGRRRAMPARLLDRSQGQAVASRVIATLEDLDTGDLRDVPSRLVYLQQTADGADPWFHAWRDWMSVPVEELSKAYSRSERTDLRVRVRRLTVKAGGRVIYDVRSDFPDLPDWQRVLAISARRVPT